MLQTKPLILKLTHKMDLDHLANLRADPEVMRCIRTGVQARAQVKE